MSRRLVGILSVVLCLLPQILFAQNETAPPGYTRHHSNARMLTLALPDGWVALDRARELTLVSRPGLESEVDRDAPRLRPGDLLVSVTVLPELALSIMGIATDDTAGIAAALHATLVAPGVPDGTADILELSALGRRVAVAEFAAGEAGNAGAFLVARPAPGLVTFAVALGRTTDLDRHRTTLATIAASVTFDGSIEDLAPRAMRQEEP